MRIKKYTVLNYKSAKLVEVVLSSNKVATFIGLNDSGKSTLLQALGLFFEEKPTIAFQTDTSKKSVLSNSPLTVDEFSAYFTENNLAKFEEYDEDLICVHIEFGIESEFTQSDLESLSEQLQCRLQGISNDGSLHVMRVFKNDGSKNDYYLLCDDFIGEDGEYSELWSQNQTVIKAAQQRFAIDDANIENKNGQGQLKKIERILAIHQAAETKPTWSKYEFKKDAKTFPEYRYLDWKIDSDDISRLASDVIQPKVEELLRPLQVNIREQADNINKAANNELQQVYDKYKSDLPVSIKGLTANISVSLQKTVTELFVEKHTADQKIHIDEQGDGVKRQIKLGLIKALAQEALEENVKTKKHIWCFDEPETHLFPQAQRELSRSLIELASAQFQVLVSTHSTLFVDRTALTDINLASLDTYYTTLRTTDNTEDIYTVLGVRNSDFLFFDRFIATEGPTEFEILNHFYYLIYNKSLIEDGIQIINLGGEKNASTCIRLVDDIFRDFQKPDDIIVYLLDKDTQYTSRHDRKIEYVGEVADFEDAISNDVWIKAIEDSCGIKITSEDLNKIRSDIDVKDANKKMHKLLKKFVWQADNTAVLPDKGKALAQLLAIHINDDSGVPESIKNAFELARKGLK